MKKVLILGGGVSGLACDFYLKSNTKVEVLGFEQNPYLGGHAYSWAENEYFWDDGPHVFFGTKNDVEPFFNFSNDTEVNATVLNYAEGKWINHPVYVNLVDLPKDEAEKLSKSLIKSRAQLPNFENESSDYKNFLIDTYGEVYSEKFPLQYNYKYWRSNLSEMSTDWINSRMFKPSIKQVLDGVNSRQNLHYINKFRYPVENGYLSYLKEAVTESRIKKNTVVKEVNLSERKVTTDSGEFNYDYLINTMPLKSFISMCRDVPIAVKDATSNLENTSMLIVNVTFEGTVEPFFHWAYIHDSSLLSTRITNYSNLNYNFDEKMFDSNKSKLKVSRLQVEVYESKSKPFEISHDEIAKKVVDELLLMGLIPNKSIVKWSIRYSAMANVIFNLKRRNSLEKIFDYLGEFGLGRTKNEFSANLNDSDSAPMSSLFLVGRFAQWNYYWTHDCARKAKIVANQISKEA